MTFVTQHKSYYCNFVENWFFLKKTLAILLSFVLLLPILVKLDILIDFKLNQDFIAKVLCINKEVPETTCNGKCYLSKQIKKVDNQQGQQAPNNKNEKPEILYYFVDSFYNKLQKPVDYSIVNNNFFLTEIHASNVVSNIFHPPKISVIL